MMNMILSHLKNILGTHTFLAIAPLLFACANLQAATYWVATNGSNSNPCTENSPCSSIQTGVKKLSAGDILNIKAGTYFETNTDGVSFFENPVAINMARSGTADNPIVIQAAPGDEGEVVIDLQATYVGFYFSGHPDFVHIKNLTIRNALHSAINVPDSGVETSYNESAKWSFGLLFEGNRIIDTYGSGAGNNTSAIRIFHVRDSIIRNNLIDRVGTDGLTDLQSHNTCIISYGLWNVTVENNVLTRCGSGAVYWKSQAKDLPVIGYQSRIRYNHFIDNLIAITDGERRGNGPHNILISNNIFENNKIGVQLKQTRVNATIAHNFFNGEGSRTTESFIVARDNLDLFTAQIYGNIYHRDAGLVYDFRPANSSITQVNHNLFTSEARAELFKYQSNSVLTRTLAEWQNLSGVAILPNNPDSNSLITPLASVSNSLAHADYTLPPNSIAIEFLPNGDNAGPYQKGNEIVGIAPCTNCSNQTAAPGSPQSFAAVLKP